MKERITDFLRFSKASTTRKILRTLALGYFNWHKSIIFPWLQIIAHSLATDQYLEALVSVMSKSCKQLSPYTPFAFEIEGTAPLKIAVLFTVQGKTPLKKA